MLKAVLFDLDGTLLPMDQEYFVEQYLLLLAKTVGYLGYEAKPLIRAVWAGTEAMYKNDGSCTNEAAFWRRFRDFYPAVNEAHIAAFDSFYAHEFDAARAFCGFDPGAAEMVHLTQALGLTPALATNPLFPRVATVTRLRWTGLRAEDFALISSYEDFHYCKPNLRYFEEFLARLSLRPEECLMVGNDAYEDMCAEKLGMPTFLLTGCLINRKNENINRWPHGDFAALRAYLQQEAAP